jgi:hypothetical protein
MRRRGDKGDLRTQKRVCFYNVECHSEEEARYLKVFLEVGLDKVKVPQDESYLNAIIPDLEEIKSRIECLG